MQIFKMLIAPMAAFVVLSGCTALNYIRGGLYRELDPHLTIVRITRHPEEYLNKEFVFSVRYYKKGDLPCPLGKDYVNFIIADRESYITLSKVWIKKSSAGALDGLTENQPIVMKAKVFKIDEAKDPNVEALEILPERKPSWWDNVASTDARRGTERLGLIFPGEMRCARMQTPMPGRRRVPPTERTQACL